MSKADQNEIYRVPSSMSDAYNRIKARQQIFSGEIEINNSPTEEDESKTSSNKVIDVITSDVSEHKEHTENLISPANTNTINLNSLFKDLELKLLSKIDKALSNNAESKIKQSNSQFDAELKIDVLSYAFKYRNCYITDTLIIFVMTEPFKLDIKEPVKFKLSAFTENFENLPVVCIGAPLTLDDLGIKLLIFVNDK